MEPVLCNFEDVKVLVSDIILKHNLINISDIKYNSGDDVKRGFSSNTVAVNILGENEERKQYTTHLWIKYISDYIHIAKLSMDKLYLNEIYFYNTIHPAYVKLLDDKNIEDGFRNTANFFGSLPKGMLALENLNYTGYRVSEEVEDIGIELVFRTYAKFHALSFVFKEQERDQCEEFRRNLFDFYQLGAKKAGIDKQVRYCIGEFLRQLHPMEDKDILDKFNVEELIRHILDPEKYATENAILTQGDCWYRNVLFLYQDEDQKNPIDMKLVDWQMIRFASPVYDLSYYFYPIASPEVLNNLQHYLQVYHEELSRQIEKLGNDPKILYPYEDFAKEWQEHSKYGFAMSSIIVKITLNKIKDVWARQEQYSERMKLLAKHFIDNNFV
ncbi:hypothetical protein Trydic_g18121 [Trypoxylus dichotomus]